MIVRVYGPGLALPVETVSVDVAVGAGDTFIAGITQQKIDAPSAYLTIREKGTVEERLHAHMIATVSGDSRRSYGLFLGLAEGEEVRPLLSDQLQFLGLIDLQDTVVGRKAPDQLYRMELATYGRGDQFDQSAAAGFIKLFGMGVRTAAEVQGKLSSLDLDKLLPGDLKRLTP